MEIEIRKLSPELAEDYVRFFDITPHDDNVEEHKCYCVCWSSEDYKGKDFSTAAERRKYAYRYIRSNNLQGYLAYSEGSVVGWCNANTKADCLKCASWRRFMDYVPLEGRTADSKVKSLFCFMIAPDMKRKGIATMLLERVCQDAARDDFDFVEVYPYKESSYQSSDFGGHFEMYRKNGFYISSESEKGLVMRKQLKPTGSE